MSSFQYGDIPNWDLQQVNKYVSLIALKNKYFGKNINKIKEFITKNSIDGEKLIWLISEPHESLLSTSRHTNVANKLKNLDRVLWKGLRWKQFLEPIISLSEANQNSTIKFCEDGGVVLDIIESKTVDENRIDRIYSLGVLKY